MNRLSGLGGSKRKSSWPILKSKSKKLLLQKIEKLKPKGKLLIYLKRKDRRLNLN